ncbi:kinase-like domain-containing protein [Gigaspora rosea]|uniref:Kinase-like domain-containing protein n=1 Tax=Gigaspora rosea TaxID=44941 RepID=A0A397V0S9_9GLOM|nr:kinase-like domain-containing protein [Gigaspora rosea]
MLKDINFSDKITQITNGSNQLNFIECQKLASMNDPEGILRLGYCYEYGIGVKKDENKAFIHYQKSSNLNNSNGMYHVGHCYYLGIGVKINKNKAFMHYLKSAEAGNSMGIFKTAICYYYGIGVKKNNDKYRYWIGKNSDYGKCTHCNEYNTNKAWCQTCDPDITIQRWTSKNKDIDDCIKGFQIRTNKYERIIEWIPFDRLIITEEIGKGGFSTVFSAIWLDGIRKIDDDNSNYTRTCEPSGTVALKTFPDSKKSTDFLRIFDNHIKCMWWGSKLKIYGLTQNTETNEYLMTFISLDLYYIHDGGYIHADFHSGNILQDGGIGNKMQSYISDLGLSKKNNENVSGSIYGVMPYVAPEVLLGQKFTQAADIYSIGAIMSEISTGQRPFDGYKFDINLAIKILNGLRPELAFGTPKCYIELARQCMDPNPQKRPTAMDIYLKLNEWSKSIGDLDDTDEIKKQFLDADEIVKKLPVVLPKYSDFIYTSKIINTRKILDAIEDSTLIELYISNNIKITNTNK